MIDTIRMFAPHGMLVDHPPGWIRTQGTKCPSTENVDADVLWWKLTHRETGLTLNGHGQKMQYMRFSLPRILHGHNYHLIKSSDEMNQALRTARDLVESVAEPLGDPNERFTRVDLVWQFRLNPQDVMNAHRSCKHPSIRKLPDHYNGESVTWKGAEMQVSMYDKCREAFKRPGDITRVEVRLLKKKLLRELGNGAERVTRLDFQACYEAYRRILLGMEPAAIPRSKLSIEEVIALAQRDSWQPFGEPLFDSCTRNMSDRNVRRLRKKVSSARSSVFQISWTDQLPPDRLPPVVEPHSPE